jgi:hypothetical protein
VQYRLDEISKRLARLEELIERVGPGIDYTKPALELLSIRGIFRMIREIDGVDDIPSLPFGL